MGADGQPARPIETVFADELPVKRTGRWLALGVGGLAVMMLAVFLVTRSGSEGEEKASALDAGPAAVTPTPATSAPDASSVPDSGPTADAEVADGGAPDLPPPDLGAPRRDSRPKPKVKPPSRRKRPRKPVNIEGTVDPFAS